MIVLENLTDYHTEVVNHPRQGERCQDCIHWRDRGHNSHCSLHYTIEDGLTVHPLRRGAEMGCQWLLAEFPAVNGGEEF